MIIVLRCWTIIYYQQLLFQCDIITSIYLVCVCNLQKFIRYIAVCIPLHRDRYTLKLIYYIIAITCFAGSYNIPRFFELKCLLVTKYICSLNSTKEVEVEKWKYNYVMEHYNLTTKDINCWSEAKYVLNTTEFRTDPLYIQVSKQIYYNS